ncbi:3-demethylubiquinone-9 3-methyltransferase [Leifsonia sp. Leaf336]|uniref:VOC family protein n=1 Tax=Leifsonia sp. Leaf336 TaxID=1736341 RepID=UPI0006F24546|nr:VOC family protein [Leifsonia sp. Leaf336]KQR54557.1 3-demethylubiquinone-9 3-methyltransferase [Leifsonia sp. Leaf336]
MQKVRTFLWYDGQAEAAANHYVSLVPDSRIVDVARLGEDGATVLVTFELGGIEYLALDGGPLYSFTEAASIMVLCEDQAEVDRLWDGLISGGGEPGPCGWCKDRWGLSWQVVPRALLELQQDPDPARAGRANAAMMKMGKLDIAALYAAADGTD